MVGVIEANGGTVGDFIGDGIMIFWNSPNDQPDHAQVWTGGHCLSVVLPLSFYLRQCLSVRFNTCGRRQKGHHHHHHHHHHVPTAAAAPIPLAHADS
eukprot:SAG22_NODE_1245_length_5020_cov_1.424304_4_plen_97_part_00